MKALENIEQLINVFHVKPDPVVGHRVNNLILPGFDATVMTGCSFFEEYFTAFDSRFATACLIREASPLRFPGS